jgi:asparagine synthase (glutamine-hydrolysing)
VCGIAGLVGHFVQSLIDRMNRTQAHRGPDGQGVFEDPEVSIALGHLRLFILDLTPAAARPMHSPSGYFSSWR